MRPRRSLKFARDLNWHAVRVSERDMARALKIADDSKHRLLLPGSAIWTHLR